LFSTWLGQHPPALDGERRWAALEHDQHSFGGNTGQPRDGQGDLGGKAGDFGQGSPAVPE